MEDHWEVCSACGNTTFTSYEQMSGAPAGNPGSNANPAYGSNPGPNINPAYGSNPSPNANPAYGNNPGPNANPVYGSNPGTNGNPASGRNPAPAYDPHRDMNNMWKKGTGGSGSNKSQQPDHRTLKIVLLVVLLAGLVVGGIFGIRALMKDKDPEKGGVSSSGDSTDKGSGEKGETEVAKEQNGTLAIVLDQAFLDQIGDCSKIQGTAEKDKEKKTFSFDAKGKAELQLPEGTWKVTIEADGYQTFSMEKKITAGKMETAEKISMEATVGFVDLALDAEMMKGLSDVTAVCCVASNGVDKEEYSFEKDGKLHLSLDPGKWTLRVECEDFDAYEEEVSVERGKTASKDVALQQKEITILQFGDLYKQYHPDYASYSLKAYQPEDYNTIISAEKNFDENGRLKLELPVGRWVLVVGTADELAKVKAAKDNDYEYMDGLPESPTIYEKQRKFLIEVTEESIKNRTAIELTFPMDCCCWSDDGSGNKLVVFADGTFSVETNDSTSLVNGKFTDFKVTKNEEEDRKDDEWESHSVDLIFTVKLESVGSNSYGLQQGNNYYFDIAESHGHPVNPDEYFVGGGGEKGYLMSEDGRIIIGYAAGQY